VKIFPNAWNYYTTGCQPVKEQHRAGRCSTVLYGSDQVQNSHFGMYFSPSLNRDYIHKHQKRTIMKMVKVIELIATHSLIMTLHN